jgi:ABC-type sulfate/molybdate transport systems ATPase subunit
MQALEQVGAAHLSRRQVNAMSGGERRRVHLARVIALNADVLLLDEPFAALDAESRDALLDDVAGPLRSSARAVVLVVHDRAEAWALADRVVVMMSGRIEADDSPTKLLATPPTPEVARFLGYTGQLADDGQLLLTRPAHAVVDPAGQYVGTVTRRVTQEDAVRLDVDCYEGHLQVLVPAPAPAIGARVRLTLVGGARFAAEPAP